MEKEYIKEQGQKIEKFLQHSFDKVKVEHIHSEEVTQRTRVGFDAGDRKDEYQVYYRISIESEDEQDILETRGDIYQYMEKQLLDMERMSSAPDTMIVDTDHPPQHIKKDLVFYVLSTL